MPCPLFFSVPTLAFSVPLPSPVWPSLHTLFPAPRTPFPLMFADLGFNMVKSTDPGADSLGANESQCVTCGQVAHLSGPQSFVQASKRNK